MSVSITKRKQQLRRQCKATRNGMGDQARRIASQMIGLRLTGWESFRESDVILTYMPMGTEVDLRYILTDFPNKRWLLPRILPDEEGLMVFHPYDPDNLIVHSLGMAEPAPHLPQIHAEEIQLVLAPGLAFDRSGWRLGYGGGYFDRFLKDFSGISVGVTFHDLLLEQIPHGKFDIPVGWVVTEKELLDTHL